MNITRIFCVFNLLKELISGLLFESLHTVVVKQNVKQKSSVHMSSLLEVLEGFFRGMEYLGKKTHLKGCRVFGKKFKDRIGYRVGKSLIFALGLTG